MTPREAAAAMRAYQKELRSPVLQTLNRVLYAARGSAMKTISGAGWGKKFYSSGTYAGGPDALAKLVRVKTARFDGQQYVGTLVAKGLPGWLEEGGHTKPHDIPKSGRKLLSNGPGGSFFAVGPVHHPGASVPGTHALQQALEKYGAELGPGIDAGLREVARRLGLAA